MAFSIAAYNLNALEYNKHARTHAHTHTQPETDMKKSQKDTLVQCYVRSCGPRSRPKTHTPVVHTIPGYLLYNILNQGDKEK